MKALGFIETKGMLAAIAAADAMLKAADVRLMGKSLATGGLVMISVAGEVAAVKAAVDAGVASVRRICADLLVSEHVIARPDEELQRITTTEPLATLAAPPKEQVQGPDPEVVEADDPASAPATTETKRHTAGQLKKMSVTKLRALAREVHIPSMPQERIASANREALIEALIKVYKQREE